MGKLEPSCSEVIADLQVPASLAAILGPGLLAAGWFSGKFLGGLDNGERSLKLLRSRAAGLP